MQIQKGTTNSNLALTLTENSTLSEPVYLFVFQRQGNDYPVISADLATTAEKERYNLFTIIEGTDDPTNGSLILGSTGQYVLQVYEQSSTTNLDPDLATNLVEEMFVRVIDTETTNYIENTISINYIENAI